MKRFKLLLAYITSQNLVADEQISAFVANSNLQLANKSETQNSMVGAYINYQAVYNIENFSGNAARLLMHFASWLNKHGQSDMCEELPPLNFDIEPVDDNTVDVMIEIDFSEEITLIQDDNGEFEFDDDHYNLGDVTIDVAESIEIIPEIAP